MKKKWFVSAKVGKKVMSWEFPTRKAQKGFVGDVIKKFPKAKLKFNL